MKPTIIAFSGGCHSGKTTTLKELKHVLCILGYKVIVLDEIIRGHSIKSIDDIRKNAPEYLKLQDTIIREKMDAELKAASLTDVDFVLIDRSVCDSLFYLTFYVDKSQLSEEQLLLYAKLFADVDCHIKYAVENIYDFIFEFEPIKPKNVDDKFRPSKLNVLQDVEHIMIKTITEGYLHFYHDKKISVYAPDINYAIDLLDSLI